MKLTQFRPSIYGILLERGRVLVCQTQTAVSTFTNFPGGGIAVGEAPRTALLREFREEVGLVVRPTAVLYTSMALHRGHVRPNQHMLGIYWAVEKVRGKLVTSGNGDDVLSARWVKPEALRSLPFTSFDREALPAILAYCRGQSLRPSKSVKTPG